MSTPTTLDVVIPTFNRSRSVVRTLESLRRAPVPAGLSVTVFVVDNASTDDTRAQVEAASRAWPAGSVQYVFEQYPGASAARNAGVMASRGMLIGFLDDDVEVQPDWFTVIHGAFADETLDFAGGPYVPAWEVPPPAWLPTGYPAVLGTAPTTEPTADYGPGLCLTSGNAVIRRIALQVVGAFNTRLGRGPVGLGSCEDHELTLRLVNAGRRGRYLPGLRVRHHIPAARTTRRYFRRWVFDHAASYAQLTTLYPEPVVHLLGIPRYYYRQALNGLGRLVARWLGRRLPGQPLDDELPIWNFAGFAWGRLRRWFDRPRDRSAP